MTNRYLDTTTVAVGAAALVIFVSACSGSAGSDAQIVSDAQVAEVRQTEESHVLDVVVNTCNADLTSNVIETVDDVTIAIDNNGETPGNDCQDTVRIELEQPLGDRTIVLSDGYVFVFRFASVTSQLENDIGDRLGDVAFEVTTAEYSDSEIAAAEGRIERNLESARWGSVTGIESGSNPDVPSRVVVHLVDPADGVTLPERIDLAPPYGPYCIWPNPSPNGPTD